MLRDFDGDLLILYGDTPLFRPASIRGLINRHRLRSANLTLLTAVADRPYPYGRVIRDSDGRIMDIIEEAQASALVKEIRELNVGAYVVSARQIWPMLATLPPSPLDGEYRLTDLAHRLIHYGLVVESYQIYDQDEIQGINTREDLERAEFILQEAAIPAAAAGRAQHHPVRHRRLARGDRRGVHAAQRAPALPGAGQRHHPAGPGAARAC